MHLPWRSPCRQSTALLGRIGVGDAFVAAESDSFVAEKFVMCHLPFLRLSLLLGLLVQPVAHSATDAPLEHEVVPVTAPDARNPCEVAVAMNPTNPDHVLAVSMQSGEAGRPRQSNYAYVSTDGGRTWKTVACPNPGGRVQADDVLAFGPDGTVYHAYIAFDGIRVPRPKRANSGIHVSRSRDGVVWDTPVPAVDHINTCEPFEDKPGIAADTTESPHRGNVYVAWTRFDVYGSKDPAHLTHVYVARSRDGGKTFSVPWRISDTPGDCLDSSNTLMGAVPAVGPQGELYVVWAGPRGIVCDRSSDGGWTFGKDVIVSAHTGWDIPLPGVPRHNGLPSIGVDTSNGPDRGTVYVCWIDKRHGDPDVFVAASRDGGTTWGMPVRVNDDELNNGKDQLFAWMAVDRVDGSVNVVFYDRRDSGDTRMGLTLARSTDGGKTFPNYRSKQEPFDGDKRFLGDYLGVDAHGGRVVAVYPVVTPRKELELRAALWRFGNTSPKGR